MLNPLKFALGVVTGAWLSASAFCLLIWSPELAREHGSWWMFALVVVFVTVLMSGLSAFFISLAMNRHFPLQRRFPAGVIAGILAIPLSLSAGMLSETPFSGQFLIHVCLITTLVCLVVSLTSVQRLSGRGIRSSAG